MSIPHPHADEQLIQVSDDDETVIGPVARRMVHGNPSIIHRAVHVVVLNRAGLMLLQKRASTKDIMPDKWDTSVGGHVGFGQSYEEAALRETEEELGIFLDVSDLEYLYFLKIRDPVESENIRSYLSFHEGPFNPGLDEVTAVQFWSRKEMDAALGTGVFTPNFEVEYSAFVKSPRGNLLK